MIRTFQGRLGLSHVTPRRLGACGRGSLQGTPSRHLAFPRAAATVAKYLLYCTRRVLYKG